MNDEERDVRLGTLTDALADTNRAIVALTDPVDTLVDAVADTSRQVAGLGQVVAINSDHIGRLASETAFLHRFLRGPLEIDHGFELGDDDDD